MLHAKDGSMPAEAIPMRTAMSLLAVLALVAATGCNKKDKNKTDEPAMGSGSSMATGSGSGGAATGTGSGSGSSGTMGSGGSGGSAGGGGSSDQPIGSNNGSDYAGSSGSAVNTGSGSDSSNMSHHTGNCPSTVYGSTTTTKVDKNVLVIAITSEDKDAVEAIHRRTTELLKEKSGRTGQGTAHDQKGTHGGSIGVCPVYVPPGSTAAATSDKKGSQVRITLKDGNLDELKKIVDVYRQSGIVLRYVLQARAQGKGVIFITHNPHHAFPVGSTTT